ncbi:hypothetical protein [Candidatus Methylacidiphilum infernorum]|nr:hypothetical protein [Candidatus Methylacidiphilum infernorum]
MVLNRMAIKEEEGFFEIEGLESRQLFAAAAVPHHLVNLNLPLDLSLQLNNPVTNQHLVNANLPLDIQAQLNNPLTGQPPIYVHVGLGGPQGTLQIGQLNLSQDLQPLLSGVNGVLNVVTGVANGLLSPLLGVILSVI